MISILITKEDVAKAHKEKNNYNTCLHCIAAQTLSRYFQTQVWVGLSLFGDISLGKYSFKRLKGTIAQDTANSILKVFDQMKDYSTLTELENEFVGKFVQIERLDRHVSD